MQGFLARQAQRAPPRGRKLPLPAEYPFGAREIRSKIRIFPGRPLALRRNLCVFTFFSPKNDSKNGPFVLF
jgi:hypothetical protein